MKKVTNSKHIQEIAILLIWLVCIYVLVNDPINKFQWIVATLTAILSNILLNRFGLFKNADNIGRIGVSWGLGFMVYLVVGVILTKFY